MSQVEVKPAPNHWGRDLAVVLVCLAVAVGFLFRDSFKSGMVLFSNDAPLGFISSATSQQASTVSGMMRGFWQDLNWIGIENPP